MVDSHDLDGGVRIVEDEDSGSVALPVGVSAFGIYVRRSEADGSDVADNEDGDGEGDGGHEVWHSSGEGRCPVRSSGLFSCLGEDGDGDQGSSS